jgi:hypothetical protein
LDSKKRENEQLKNKNDDLESVIKSLRDTNDFQRRLNDENENNKRELKRKQDDFEQFQKVCRKEIILMKKFLCFFL